MSAFIRQLAVARAQREEFLAQRERLIAEARGDNGAAPAHEWEGTRLRFQNPDGTWGEWVDLRGKAGKTGKEGKPGLHVIGGGGSRFDPASLPVLDDAALISDFLVLEREGKAYRVSLSQLQIVIGGGGTQPTGGVTLNGEDITVGGVLVTVNGGVATDEGEAVLTKRIDTVSDSLVYRGEAQPGTAESAPTWRIARIEFTQDGDVTELWAGGNAAFAFAWADRATLTYS